MTLGGNSFNYFPENQLTNFKLCLPNLLILSPREDFCDAFCVAGRAFERPWVEAPRGSIRLGGLGCVLSFPRGIWGEAPASNSFFVNFRLIPNIF